MTTLEPRPKVRPVWPARTTQHDCPTCACCTAELCRKAVTSLRGCHAHTAAEHQQTVSDCPCSAPTTTASSSQLDATEHVRPYILERSDSPPFAPVVLREAVMDELVMTDAGYHSARAAHAYASTPGVTLLAICQVTTTVIAAQPTSDAGSVAGGESW